jgi:hypothetical protein
LIARCTTRCPSGSGSTLLNSSAEPEANFCITSIANPCGVLGCVSVRPCAAAPTLATEALKRIKNEMRTRNRAITLLKSLRHRRYVATPRKALAFQSGINRPSVTHTACQDFRYHGALITTILCVRFSSSAAFNHVARWLCRKYSYQCFCTSSGIITAICRLGFRFSRSNT